LLINQFFETFRINNMVIIAVDEPRLEADLGYRFEYVSGFMGFGAADIKLIHASAQLLAPLVPGLVDAVYDQLFKYDATKRHFVPRQAGYEGAVPADLGALTLNDPQIAFRKQHLGNYLQKLVTANYDGKLLEYLDMVGRIHTAKAGNKEIVIPMVQMNALMGFVADALIATIASLPLDDSTKMMTIRAFSKLLWIQQDLIIRAYQS
jgi:hypothetical protein